MNNPFAEPFSPYLPENYDENSVSYLGTHDNDTITGYINNLNEGVRHNIEKHFDLTPGTKYNESLIKKYSKEIYYIKKKKTSFIYKKLTNIPRQCNLQ